ncbi:hypothetical protein [Paenibacillus sp. UMB4589-SE434]|uniref:hypothetical protein n=1 Tax=Paenibacillus sp. UMB4589-SE434 TaxID=3046314 RepID=UPI00254D1507|nr:hypothetical protein [Paenibacillus sp. UMB4589-SE434]MDK8182113.1 hypothetical protein [Paenibacillus sp. UMB4589-SE434]
MATKEKTELEALIQEKITLAQKLGLWGDLEPVDGYKEVPEYARINEIDKRLWELV